MSRLLLVFSMSLDGFVAGPNISMEQPMGEGGECLHDWMFSEGAKSGVDAEMAKEQAQIPGAVILGRHTFDLGLPHWQDTPYPVPSFVLTHEAREPLAMKSASFTFVNDGIESALRQAKAVAGDKDIVVMGAETAQQYLSAGLVDGIILQLVPVLLGGGKRLFDQVAAGAVELQTERAIMSPFVTHLKFKVAGGRRS